MEPQPSNEGFTQQKQRLRCLVPSSPSSRRWCIAATSLFLAAVIAVAVAVPVAQARPSIADDAGSSNARQLAALSQRPAANSRVAATAGPTEAGRKQQQEEPACQGVPGLCKVPVRSGGASQCPLPRRRASVLNQHGRQQSQFNPTCLLGMARLGVANTDSRCSMQL
jgi:hypothetical protein